MPDRARSTANRRERRKRTFLDDVTRKSFSQRSVRYATARSRRLRLEMRDSKRRSSFPRRSLLRSRHDSPRRHAATAGTCTDLCRVMQIAPEELASLTTAVIGQGPQRARTIVATALGEPVLSKREEMPAGEEATPPRARPPARPGSDYYHGSKSPIGTAATAAAGPRCRSGASVANVLIV
jgi:hypothetical protein